MPTAVDCIDLKRRFDALVSSRSSVEQEWDAVERFVAPLGSGAQLDAGSGESSVRWRRSEVWDFTAIDGAQKLAASIHGSVTSPAVRWFRLQFREKALNEDREAREWLDAVGDRIFDALQDSDFNKEVSSCYQDLVAFGNTFVVEEAVEDGTWQGIDFTAVPLREAYFEEDWRGGVLRFFRRLSWTPAQIVDKFGELAPQAVKEKAAKPEGASEKLEVIFCIFPRPKVAKERVAAPELRPWGMVHFLGETGERLGDEGGYYEMPVFLARWEKTSASRWGHGPGNIALSTVMYLNAFLEATLGAAEKAVDPPMMTTERGLLSDLDMESGGLTVVSNPEDLRALPTAGRFDVSVEMIQDLRSQIRSIFKTDELQLRDSPAMTATEVQVRYELMNRVLGSTLARLQADFLGPLIEIAAHILGRSGQLPAMPDQVKRAGGQTNIEYQGPISRAQRSDEVASIERLASFVAGLVKMGFTDAAAVFDAAKAVRETADRLGVPAAVIASPEEVQKKNQAAAQLQQRMAQAEAARAEGEAVAQRAEAQGAVQSMPAQPTPIVAPTLLGA